MHAPGAGGQAHHRNPGDAGIALVTVGTGKCPAPLTPPLFAAPEKMFFMQNITQASVLHGDCLF